MPDSAPHGPRRRLGPLPTILGLLVLAVTLAVLVGPLFGYRVHAITTGSMTGTADAGSLVISRFEPTGELRVGDVITYLPPPDAPIDAVITHRIVDITTNDDGTLAYTTQGDANADADPWTFQLTDEQQMVMHAAVPHLGRPVLFLSDPATRRVAIGGPALVIAALALRDIIRLARHRDDEADTTDALDAIAAARAAISAVDQAIGVAERPNAPARHPQPKVVVARPVTKVLDLTQVATDATPAAVTHTAEAAPAVRRVVVRRVVVPRNTVAATPPARSVVVPRNTVAATPPVRRVVVVRAADRRPSTADVR